MGYDAYVRCCCFKKGLAKPFKYAQYLLDTPEYFELNLPPEIKGTKLEEGIEDEFSSWECNGCEHEDGVYYRDRICNSMGMVHFRSTLYSLDGGKKFPTLFKYLPESNDGYLPFEENKNFKNDLLNLKYMGEIRSLRLCYKDDGGYLNRVANTVNGDTETFFMHPKAHMGLNHDNFFVSVNDEIAFESSNFTVEKTTEGYVFEDHDTKETFVCEVFFTNEYILEEKLFEKMQKINFSIEQETIDIQEAHGYIIDTLLVLIEKSNEVGYPICWS